MSRQLMEMGYKALKEQSPDQEAFGNLLTPKAAKDYLNQFPPVPKMRATYPKTVEGGSRLHPKHQHTQLPDLKPGDKGYMNRGMVMEMGYKALKERSFSYKRNPDGSIHKGGAIRTNRDIGKYMEMLRKKGKDVPASEFNRYALNALDGNKYPWGNMPDTPDTFSSDKALIGPFKGMNKDKNYYMQAPYVGMPNLETGVDNNRSIYPSGPTIGPTEPVVKGEEGKLDYFKSLSKPRTSYDI